MIYQFIIEILLHPYPWIKFIFWILRRVYFALWWSRKLAPLSQPIRCKTKTNHDLAARVFSRFRNFGCFYFEFKYFPFFRLAVVISLLSVSWHLIENKLTCQVSNNCSRITFTFLLPWVTKTEFLLTLSIQHQADKWWE